MLKKTITFLCPLFSASLLLNACTTPNHEGDSAASNTAKSAPPAATSPAPTSQDPKNTAPQTPTPQTTTSATTTTSLTAAEATLAKIPVKGKAPKTGYRRENFGPAWADVDHNGCDTRNDILRRDLTQLSFRPGTHNCIVLSGILVDPYTGKTISFIRGRNTSQRVQIDHIVALNNAWQTGAQLISAAERKALANDPLNLLAVDGPTNQAKGAADAASWLPANKAFRCEYAQRQVAVKSKYHLWVTPAEKAALVKILAKCPDK